ncbi:metal-sulfur cluster assembly factor [Granulicella arctica]|uniref:metal-sulfur cluster assembly factor n=1 Tax=Granulicella arctica TaxID=940613 RepID=UPI0021E00FF2|nr:metal-sulfur cluster assembly factor [Granulicella arctica]
MLTEDEVRGALRDCYDPEIPCNIVDLGLVQTIFIERDLNAPGASIPGVPEKHRVAVTLTPSNPTEDAEAQLRAQIANRLAGFETISGTTVHIVHTPQWTPQDITPTGRRTLGLDGNPALVQIR